MKAVYSFRFPPQSLPVPPRLGVELPDRKRFRRKAEGVNDLHPGAYSRCRQGISTIGEPAAQEKVWIPVTIINVVVVNPHVHTGMYGGFATVVGSTIGGTGGAEIEVDTGMGRWMEIKDGEKMGR